MPCSGPKRRSVALPILLVTLSTSVGVACWRATRPLNPASEGASALDCIKPDGGHPICLDYKLPTSFGDRVSQATADSIAWQDFIALNWPVAARPGYPDQDASDEAFGRPAAADGGVLPGVVWPSYMDTLCVFQPDAARPPPWGASANFPMDAGCTTPDGGPIHWFSPASVTQPLSGDPAQGGAPRSWLADKAGNLIYYEIKLNELALAHIVDSGFYNAANQWAASVPPDAGMSPGVQLPEQSITLKASWRVLTDPALYARYLTIQAVIPMPGGRSERAMLGLVGLHIVHKLEGQPQWLWATFEQIDNAPTADTVMTPPSDAGFTFYDPSCDAGAPGPCRLVTACSPNTMPPFDLSDYFAGAPDACAPYPIQVVRQTPIPREVEELSRQVQGLIRGANPVSVFQYYQLVNNAIWWALPPPNSMKAGAPVPLETTNQVPPGDLPVANVTLETYEQPLNCLGCHMFGPVSTRRAGPLLDGGDGGEEGMCDAEAACASDFSFIFEQADLPAAHGPTP